MEGVDMAAAGITVAKKCMSKKTPRVIFFEGGISYTLQHNPRRFRRVGCSYTTVQYVAFWIKRYEAYDARDEALGKLAR